MPKKTRHESIPDPLLTTGDIANYCHTGMTQVNRWIKLGKLEAFRNPGGHYRVTRKKFREFLEKNGMPIIEEFFRGVKKKKILIADDDTHLANMIGDVLLSRYKDIELKIVHNGYDALITVGNFIPDIVILDIRMPKIDGLEVCRRIRENETLSSGIKILAITAHSDYTREKVLKSGADEYLLKPLDMDVLLEHVENLT
ncbi:MAG: response regulator [Candidatus Latescibacteria bacterium]|nr:response regulator [Candidatus Latescibacterota bacterium]